MEHEKRFIIYKKVAKQGNQAIIVIPRLFEKKLKPGTLTKLTIDILEEVKKQEQ
ncbi:MAG: hypothetical protein AABX11_07880 [Nanoarchaeota archaeon]